MQLKEETKKRKARKVARLAEADLTLCYKAVSAGWDEVDVLMFDDGDTHIPQDLIDFAVDHNCHILYDDCTGEVQGKSLIIYNLIVNDKKGGFKV